MWAGFLAILAAGIGYGIRGGILANWAADFGFTGAQLEAIGGAFTGFCFGIIIGGVVVDKIGYGKAGGGRLPVPRVVGVHHVCRNEGTVPATAYLFLYIGTFVFASPTARSEAVANPLVSTLFHYARTF